MNNIMGALLDDYRIKGLEEGREEGREEGKEEGTIVGALLTLARYGKLKGKDLIEAAVSICGNDYEVVETIYQELVEKGELH